MNGFEYAQAIHDNLAEPDTDHDPDEPECGGCHPSYRNACDHCGPDND